MDPHLPTYSAACGPMVPTPQTHEDYTVGWICTLPIELTAATAMLDTRHNSLPKAPNDSKAYTLGQIGPHNIVLACLPKGVIGTASAATVATSMLSTFPAIKFGLLVGIGGGVPRRGVRLGDVVVSTPRDQYPGVVQWDMGKAEREGFRQTGALSPPPSLLLAAISKLETQEALYGSQIPAHLTSVRQRLPHVASNTTRADLTDVLFRADYHHVPSSESLESMDTGGEDIDGCSACDRAQSIPRRPRGVRVHFGLIASGNQVIKDATIRDMIYNRLDKQPLCFEMEAAGLMRDFPCVVIRGICDYADSHKNKAWQGYAAFVAAAFAKELLSEVEPAGLSQMPLIKKVQSTVAQAHKDIDQLQRGQLDIALRDWLDWIVNDNRASSLDRHVDLRRTREEGTGAWLLESAEFQTWCKRPTGILFCPGIPGAGKTVMSSIVVDHLHRLYGREQGIGLAFLYCTGNTEPPHFEKLITDIFRQLVLGRKRLLTIMKQLCESYPIGGLHPPFGDILQALFAVVAEYRRVFIIIDGLDETYGSDGNHLGFSDQLLALQSKFSQVNLFITSRLIPDLLDRFDRPGVLRLEIRAQKADLLRYIQGNRDRLPQQARRDDIFNDIQSKLILNSDGMFLIVQLRLNSLASMRSLGMLISELETYGRSAPTCDTLYEQTMDRLCSQTGHSLHIAVTALSWVLRSRRNLTVQELQHAVAASTSSVEVKIIDLVSIDDLVSVCAGLVVAGPASNLMSLVHSTARAYLEATQTRWLPSIETNLTEQCIRYLSYPAFSSGVCPTPEMLEARFLAYPLYDYAARYWGHHARGASKTLRHVIIQFIVQSTAHVAACSQAMLASSTDICSVYESRQMSPLHLVAYFGLDDLATQVGLKDSDKYDLADEDSRTPLLWAARNGHASLVALFLAQAQVDPNARDKDGRTPLWWAANKGHVAVVRLLLSRPDVLHHSRDNRGWDPLMRAIFNSREDVVRIIVDMSVDLASDDDDGRTPLWWAAARGNQAILLALIPRCSMVTLNQVDRFGWSPLSRAVFRGHGDVVRSLLQTDGVDANQGGKDGQTPLWWALKQRNMAMVHLLLASDKKDFDLACKAGRTPLSWAAGMGFENIAALLLTRDAHVDSRDHNGRTPLSWAVAGGHSTTVHTLLLSGGANVDEADNQRRTPLWWAIASHQEALIRLLLSHRPPANIHAQDKSGQGFLCLAAARGQESVVNLLLTARDPQDPSGGVDVHAVNHNGQTALSVAAAKGHSGIVAILLGAGVDPNVRDSATEQTALSWAARNGRDAVVRLLLACETVVCDSRDGLGRTALSWAATEGHSTIVESFLSAAAVAAGQSRTALLDINTQDHDGRTPLAWAAAHGHDTIVDTLLQSADIRPSLSDRQGHTPLSRAAAKGHETVVARLIATPTAIDLNTQDAGGRTPLSWAASQGHTAVVQILLASNGIDSERRDRLGRTPLVWAAASGQTDVVQQLLSVPGVDPESRDRKGCTPMQLALLNHHPDAARILQNMGNGTHSNPDAAPEQLHVAGGLGRFFDSFLSR